MAQAMEEEARPVKGFGKQVAWKMGPEGMVSEEELQWSASGPGLSANREWSARQGLSGPGQCDDEEEPLHR